MAHEDGAPLPHAWLVLDDAGRWWEQWCGEAEPRPAITDEEIDAFERAERERRWVADFLS